MFDILIGLGLAFCMLRLAEHMPALARVSVRAERDVGNRPYRGRWIS